MVIILKNQYMYFDRTNAVIESKTESVIINSKFISFGKKRKKNK